MKLRQPSSFVAVAEELDYGRSAAKILIAQPAVSNLVPAPEKELGVQLFIHTTRWVELTRAGAAFYEGAVSILGGSICRPRSSARSPAR